MRSNFPVPVVIAAVLASGCATQGGYADSGQARSENVCLSDYQVTSFSPVGDSHLYVEGIGKHQYLLTMERNCFGLQSANTIGFPDRVGRICGKGADRIIYRDVTRQPASCRILDIEAVQDRDDARQLAEAREKAR